MKMTLIALLISQAIVLSFFERFIPISFAIPGAKLGLANIITLIALMRLSKSETLFIVVSRVILASFMFGSMSSLLYSMSGALLAFVVMSLLSSLLNDSVSIFGVSIAGAVAHNVGQVIAAALVIENVNIFYYLPLLLLIALPTGFAIGLVSKQVLKYLKFSNI